MKATEKQKVREGKKVKNGPTQLAVQHNMTTYSLN